MKREVNSKGFGDLQESGKEYDMKKIIVRQ